MALLKTDLPLLYNVRRDFEAILAIEHLSDRLKGRYTELIKAVQSDIDYLENIKEDLWRFFIVWK